jgi:hypothetical protein
MNTVEPEVRHYYAATAPEIEEILNEPLVATRLKAQNELANKVALGSEQGQGYTNEATFRAIMTGGPSPRNMTEHEAEPKKFAKLFEDLEAFKYVAGEPHASNGGRLNFIGIILMSQFAEFSGESLVYSVKKIAGESVEEPEEGQRFWGQILMYNWRAGIRHDSLNRDWEFTGVDEIGVIERGLTRSVAEIRRGPSHYNDLIGMPAIRSHVRKEEPSKLEVLPGLFAQVREKVGKLAIQAPGDSRPPVNYR